MILLVFIIIVGYILSKIYFTVFKNNLFEFLFTYSLIIILTGFVTYTPDWAGYDAWVRQGSGRDIFFNYLIDIISPDGYKQIHIIFTTVYSLLLLFFITRFSKHTLLITLLYIPIIYLYYTTQIRFFMGYYSLWLGFYLWYVNNNKKTAIIFIVFAIANHLSLIILLPIIYFLKDSINSFHKKVIWALIFLTFGYFFVFNLLQYVIPQSTPFLNYILLAEFDSSILGGLFSFLPAIIGIYLVYKYLTKKLKHNEELSTDKKIQFLYRLSITPVIFISIALNRQIVGHRFIIPALLYQLLLIIYIATKYNTRKQNFNLVGFIFLYFLFYLNYIYIISPIVVGNEITKKVSLMLNSNSIIGHWF
ncbi:MAG: EpsG family protein [Bacteroidota bacterium]